MNGRVFACMVSFGLLCASIMPSTAAAVGQRLWIADGRPSAKAHEAMNYLQAADSHGLEPRDYGGDALLHDFVLAMIEPVPDPDALARFDHHLTVAMQRFLDDLRWGRADPRDGHGDLGVSRPERIHRDGAIRQALATNTLAALVARSTPQLPMYSDLRTALRRYRELDGHPAWSGSDSTEKVASRLAALGDLDPTEQRQSSTRLPDDETTVRVDPAVLTEAVRSFQRRHGLVDDGRLGEKTRQALAVSPQWRARQIELGLERMRWTPLLQGPRMIVINVPEFVLRAYTVQKGQIQIQHEMRVVVGDARDTRTPLFNGEMRSIEFNPYWNVPYSIARNELVPRLSRDPRFLDAQGFEFVGLDGRVSRQVTSDLLRQTLSGAQRLRQRPGPANALGRVKFVLPNSSSIYLHHTPATDLFGRERRDFSHGCIRVEDPLALATFAMQGMAQWPGSRIASALAGDSQQAVILDNPVPVVIAYGTALVIDSQVRFYEDIYGHDERLDIALRRQSMLRRLAAEASGR